MVVPLVWFSPSHVRVPQYRTGTGAAFYRIGILGPRQGSLGEVTGWLWCTRARREASRAYPAPRRLFFSGVILGAFEKSSGVRLRQGRVGLSPTGSAPLLSCYVSRVGG